MFFFFKLLSRLPLPILYAISSFFASILKRAYRRKLVMKNLAIAFPNKSQQELEQTADRFYENFADMIIEVLKGTTMDEGTLAKRINFVNPEIVFELKRKNKPLLFYASHHYNWEWMAMASAAGLMIPADVIYQPLEDKKANDFIYKIRSRFGGNPIANQKAAREILKRRKEHCIIGLVVDQSPPRDSVHWTRFLGKETDFYPGLVQLPYMMQATAVFGRIIKKKRGYYDIELIPIGQPPYGKGDFSVLKNYVEETERLIMDHPEGYLWSHNRWKHTRDESEEIIIFS